MPLVYTQGDIASFMDHAKACGYETKLVPVFAPLAHRAMSQHPYARVTKVFADYPGDYKVQATSMLMAEGMVSFTLGATVYREITEEQCSKYQSDLYDRFNPRCAGFRLAVFLPKGRIKLMRRQACSVEVKDKVTTLSYYPSTTQKRPIPGLFPTNDDILFLETLCEEIIRL